MKNVTYKLFDGSLFAAKRTLPKLTSYTIHNPEQWTDEHFRTVFDHVFKFPTEEAKQKMGFESSEYRNDIFQTAEQTPQGNKPHSKIVGYLSGHELSSIVDRQYNSSPELFGRNKKTPGAFPSKGTWTYHIHALIAENEKLADHMLHEIETLAAQQRYRNITVEIAIGNFVGQPYFSSKGYEILGCSHEGSMFMIKRKLVIPDAPPSIDYRKNQPTPEPSSQVKKTPITPIPGSLPKERPTSGFEDLYKD